MTAPAPDDRWLPLQGAANARDLGGLPLTTGGSTLPGVALRADNLQDLTPADVALLVDRLGLRTVVDLRTTAEVEAEGPGPLDRDGRVHHRHRSLVPAADVDDDRVIPDRAGQSQADVYRHYLTDDPAQAVGAVRDLLADADGAALFHCAAGKDRTGVLAALVEDAVGVTRDAVVADYLLTAERVEGVLARLLATPTYAHDLAGTEPASHLPRRESLESLLRWLDEGWGGAAGWLLAHGLADAELARLRHRLTGA